MEDDLRMQALLADEARKHLAEVEAARIAAELAEAQRAAAAAKAEAERKRKEQEARLKKVSGTPNKKFH
jgi:hypothetical protein